jgi:hypothetical protein
MPLVRSALSDLAELFFQNVQAANWGDAAGLRGSVDPGAWWCSLHNGSPGVGADQTLNEITTGGYVRAPLVRDPAAVSVTESGLDALIRNLAALNFGLVAQKQQALMTHIGLGFEPTGPGDLKFSFELEDHVTIPEGEVIRINPNGIDILWR